MKRRHQLEKHLYRLLGVETFRRLVFLLERFVHRKDHGRNDNYHISSFTQGALEDFVKYLFYNGSIHVRNILILLIYFIVKIVLHVPLRWYDTFALLLGLKDVFCVMLQRYNYLRILERKQKLDARYQIHIQRRVSELRKSFCASYDAKMTNKDLQVVRSIKDRIAAGIPVILTSDEEETLNRLAVAMSTIQRRRHEQ